MLCSDSTPQFPSIVPTSSHNEISTTFIVAFYSSFTAGRAGESGQGEIAPGPPDPRGPITPNASKSGASYSKPFNCYILKAFCWFRSQGASSSSFAPAPLNFLGGPPARLAAHFHMKLHATTSKNISSNEKFQLRIVGLC